MAATLPAPPPDVSPADLLSSLALHADNEAYAVACASVISARAAADGDAFTAAGGLSALCSLLRAHPTSELVCEHASHALWMMNYVPARTAASTVALGAVPLLAQHWAAHACHYTHLALEVLGYSDEGAWVGAEGLPSLEAAKAAQEGEELLLAVRLYSRAAGDAAVALAACTHLAALAFEGGGDEKCFAAGALPVLVSILANNMASEEVACTACNALRMVCYFPTGGSGYICSAAIALGAPRLLHQARQAYDGAVYAAPALEALGYDAETGAWAEMPSPGTPAKRITELLSMGKCGVPGLLVAAAQALGGLQGEAQEEALRAGALPLLRSYLALLDESQAPAALAATAASGQALNAAGVPATLARTDAATSAAYYCGRTNVVPSCAEGLCSSEGGGGPCSDCAALAPRMPSGQGAAAAAALRAAITTLTTQRPSVAAERARRAAAIARMEARAQASPAGSGLRRDWEDFCAAQAEVRARSAAWVSEHGAGVPFRDGWSGSSEAVGEGWSGGEGATWLPAAALVPAPVLVEGGYAVNDVGQGALGDCYLLAGLADLGDEAGDVLDSIFVSSEASECGVVCVRLWCDGAWKWVFMDDLFLSDSVPDHSYCQYTGGGGRKKYDGVPNPALGSFYWLLTAHSTGQESEMWPSYLEKAWAFIHGSYAGITGGRIARSPCCAVQCSGFPLNFFLSDSLPGFSESFPDATATDSQADALWGKLTGWLAQGWLVTTGTSAVEGEDSEAKAADGLLSNHQYSLLRCLNTPGLPRLVQLRNPHGHGEWVGAYSDEDRAHWTPALIAATGYDPAAASDEGVFWLPLRSWMERFDGADVVPRVRLGAGGGGWCQVLARGDFAALDSAVENSESAAAAPQYLLALEAPGSVHINVRQGVQGGEVAPFKFNLLVQRREAGEALEQPVEASLSASCALVLTMARGETTCVLELEAGGYAIIPFLEEPTPTACGFSVNVASRSSFTLRAAQPGVEGSELLPACT